MHIDVGFTINYRFPRNPVSSLYLKYDIDVMFLFIWEEIQGLKEKTKKTKTHGDYYVLNTV